MKNTVKLIRISSKFGFRILKEKSPFFCSELKEKVNVTNIFYKHIAGYKKFRTNTEIIQRLSLINLTEEILINGNIFEERENGIFEGKKYAKTFKISLKNSGIYFILVVGKKENGENILLSCFAKFL